VLNFEAAAVQALSTPLGRQLSARRSDVIMNCEVAASSVSGMGNRTYRAQNRRDDVQHRTPAYFVHPGEASHGTWA